MSIAKEAFEKEKQHLSYAKQYIEKLLDYEEEKNKKIEGKVKVLKKKSSTYNVELITAEKLLGASNKNLHKLNEGIFRPYFGRIDFKDKLDRLEELYIGKQGIVDDENVEAVVIDWRAPIADLYYSGTGGKASYESPDGTVEGELLLKRKFLIEEGELIDAFDEGIDELIISGKDGKGNELIDEFLKLNLEKGSSKKLKEIVSTIQKEQNDIIREKLSVPVVLQGSAGSGKTTVALHRLAYLIYRYKNILKAEDVLVVAPNKLFVNYISDILPDLGADNIPQFTFEELSFKFVKHKHTLKDKDKEFGDTIEEERFETFKAIAYLKSSYFYKEVLDRLIKYIQIEDCKVNNIVVGEYILFRKTEIQKLYVRDFKHLPIRKRKEEIAKYLKERTKKRIESINEEIEVKYFKEIKEIKKNIAEGEARRLLIASAYEKRDEEKENIKIQGNIAIKAFLKEWEILNLEKYYFSFLENKELFNTITSGKVPKKLEERMRARVIKNLELNDIDVEDLIALTYLAIKVDGVTEKYKHIVVDEAQDCSIIQYEILKEMSKNNSFTIVGDVGQSIYYFKGLSDWNILTEKIFNDKVKVKQLTKGYRSTIEIMDFAQKVLEKQGLDYKAATPVLRHGEEPQVIKIDSDESFIENLDRIVEEGQIENKQRIAVICKSTNECKKVYHLLKEHSIHAWSLIEDTEKEIKNDCIVIPSNLSKGLEFDYCIINDCSNDKYSDNMIDKKILYVALTRALHKVFIFYREELSVLIK